MVTSLHWHPPTLDKGVHIVRNTTELVELMASLIPTPANLSPVGVIVKPGVGKLSRARTKPDACHILTATGVAGLTHDQVPASVLKPAGRESLITKAIPHVEHPGHISPTIASVPVAGVTPVDPSVVVIPAVCWATAAPPRGVVRQVEAEKVVVDPWGRIAARQPFGFLEFINGLELLNGHEGDVERLFVSIEDGGVVKTGISRRGGHGRNARRGKERSGEDYGESHGDGWMLWSTLCTMSVLDSTNKRLFLM